MTDPTELLAKYSAPVPRYTSYPTAPHFQPGIGGELAEEQLAGIGRDEPVSVYIHIPYCDRLCWFCGCHTKQTLKYAPVEKYVGTLIDEIAIVSEKMAFLPRLKKLHLGGGSPSMLKPPDFARLRAALENAFVIGPDSEISVEIDPSDEPGDMMAGLEKIGITRASIGVQDFDEAVQKAINRPQAFETTHNMVVQLREAGVDSINIDVLYGLPLQNIQRITKTVEQVIKLQPDRVALFGYAHVPWMKKHQQMIRDEDLPIGMERFGQAGRAEETLVEAGYVKIGIDHYALPGDRLAIAHREGRLRRNFQGYTTDSCTTLIGLGASAIGRSKNGYIQNIVPTGQYQAAVADGVLPAARGYRMTADDHARGHAIERLMCDFSFDLDDVETRFGTVGAVIAAEARAIAKSETDGLCRIEDGRFVIPIEARPFARIVAARFDAHIKETAFRYSRAI